MGSLGFRGLEGYQLQLGFEVFQTVVKGSWVARHVGGKGLRNL